MRRTPVTASRSAFVLLGLTLAVMACTDTTTPPVVPRMVFDIEPVNTSAGSAIFPALVVAFEDDAGNPLTDEARQVSLSLNGVPGATLQGTVSAHALNGKATFPGLRINIAGAAYSITASAPGVDPVTSAPFSVTAGAPTQIAFVTQPGTTPGRVPMAPVRVAIQDYLGNTVTSASDAITIALSSSPPANLTGVTTVEAVNGIATFTGLTIDNTGNAFILMASRNGFQPAFSTTFSVTFSTAVGLVFGVEPWTVKAAEPVLPAVTVLMIDAHGNTVTNAPTTITISLGQNPAGGTLSGTMSGSSSGGVATFHNLRVDRLGSGYTLTAAATGLSPAQSAIFAVTGPLTFRTVSSGYFHSCGIATDNVAYCWGINSSGELGNPKVEQTKSPVPVLGGPTFTSISAGRSHSCALTAGGTAYCWGANFDGQLGNASTAMSRIPSPVAGNLTFAQLTAGYNHTCGVTTAGVGYCWGDNSQGQIGNVAATTTNVPDVVAGGLVFASVSPGRQHSCGRTTNGLAYCWGDNTSGQVGDGTVTNRGAPTPVQGGFTFSSVSAGGFHSCGTSTDGVARCWGANAVGQLGNNTTEGRNIPGTASGALSFAAISAGNRHTCAVTSSSSVHCWGENTGAFLGDGTVVNRLVPTATSGAHSFASVSAGRFHSCAVTVASEAYCWGDNSSGRLGVGESTIRLEPTRVR